jgi:hypothetical protein
MDNEIVFKYVGILFKHKKDGILSFSAIWLILEDIMLSEISQAQKGKCHKFPLILELKQLLS